MSTKIGEAYYDITARADKLEAELKKVQSQMEAQHRRSEGLFSSMQTGYLAVAGGVAIVTAALVKCVKAASNLEEQTAKFKTVFGDQLGKANASVENLTANYAMSTREARQYLSAMQDLLVPMGMNRDLAADYSDEIVRLAADIGSFNNLPTADVMMDIQSAMVGNFETMKKYGVVLNEEAVKREAVNLGLAKQGDMLSQVNKVQSAYSLILKGTQAAQGDMIRTSDSWANMMKKIGAQTEDLMATIGNDMLPGLRQLAKQLMSSDAAGAVMIGAMRDVATFISMAAGAVAKLVGWIDELEKKYGVLSRFGDTIAAGPLGALYKYNKAIFNLAGDKKKATDTIFSTATEEITAFGKSEKAANSYGDALKKLQKEQNLTSSEAKKAAEAEMKLAEERKKIEEDMRNGIIQTTSDLAGAVSDLVNNVFDSQIQALEKQYDAYLQYLDLWKASAMDAAGFAEKNDRKANAREIATLKKKIKTEKDITKKNALEKELFEKEHLQKKYDIEYKYEVAKYLLEEMMNRRRAVMQRQAAIASRTLAIFQISISTAMAIMQAWQAAWQTSGGVWPAALAMGAVSTALLVALAAVQTASVLSAPMPMAAAGMVSNRPAIFGEAGPEMAVPLSGAYGQKAIGYFVASMLDELQRRADNNQITQHSYGQTVPQPASLSTADQPAQPIIVNIAGKYFYSEISRASSNGQIIIDARSVKKR